MAENYEQLQLFCQKPRVRDDRKGRDEVTLENGGIIYVYDYREQRLNDPICGKVRIYAMKPGETGDMKLVEENRWCLRWEEYQKQFMKWIDIHKDKYEIIEIYVSFQDQQLLFYSAPHEWRSMFE